MSSETGETRQVPDEQSAATAEIDLDWLTLDSGEEVLWASTPHKSSLVPALVVGIPLSFVLVGIPIVVSAYLSYTNTNYVVTTRGLYRKRGILSRDVKQIGFDKVQNISYTQSAVGSSLGYGTVEISTAGSSGVELRFRSIPTPAAIQELISREIERREDSRGDREDDADAVLDEILAELRGIRAALETRPEEPKPIGAETGGPAAGGQMTDDNETDRNETGEGSDTAGDDPGGDDPVADDPGGDDPVADDPGDDDAGDDGDTAAEDPDDPFEPAITKPADDEP